MARVAIIGLSPLEEEGMKNIALSENVSAVCSSTRKDISLQELDGCDGILTTVDQLLAGIEYFLPRKDKLLLLSDSSYNGFFTVSRNASVSELRHAIHTLVSSKKQHATAALSRRETDVLRLLAQGLTIKEISDRLHISSNTTTTHRKNISLKLGIRSVSGLSLYAMMNGII